MEEEYAQDAQDMLEYLNLLPAKCCQICKKEIIGPMHTVIPELNLNCLNLPKLGPTEYYCNRCYIISKDMEKCRQFSVKIGRRMEKLGMM